MKIIIAILASLLLITPVYSQDNRICSEHTPYGYPMSRTDSVYAIVCHTGYLTHFDTKAKIPDWVSYTLTPSHALGCSSRSNAFSEDPSETGDQANPKDYDYSGYDRGHQAPDSDMRWNSKVEAESFYMTNMAPQRPSFNRGIWKKLETDVRNWTVFRNENLTIYTGPVYNISSDKKFKGIDIPTGFYKIILDNETHESISFLFDNQDTANGDNLESHITTIDNIEKATGITFPVAKETSKSEKSDMWLSLKGEFSKEKTKACKK